MKTTNTKEQNEKLERIKQQADQILRENHAENGYYTYRIWENYGKKRAYFQAQEDGHGFDGDKTKPLRRTEFYVDMTNNTIVDAGLYADLKEIKNIKVE